MKKVTIHLAGLTSLFLVSAKAQEIPPGFSVGADFYSNYIWRGSKLGTGPALQPSLKFTKGIFTVGVWGSYDVAGYTETDPYFTVSLADGLRLGMTDYYFGTKLFDVSDSSGSHAFEVNIGFLKGNFSLAGNYMLNESAVPGSKGGDMYYQVSYAFKAFNISVGAGNGLHTKDPDQFAVCHIGLGTTKSIKITDNFSLPVTGQVIVNPDKEVLYLVVGFSL